MRDSRSLFGHSIQIFFQFYSIFSLLFSWIFYSHLQIDHSDPLFKRHWTTLGVLDVRKVQGHWKQTKFNNESVEAWINNDHAPPQRTPGRGQRKVCYWSKTTRYSWEGTLVRVRRPHIREARWKNSRARPIQLRQWKADKGQTAMTCSESKRRRSRFCTVGRKPDKAQTRSYPNGNIGSDMLVLTGLR